MKRVLEKEGFTYNVKDEIVVIKRKVESNARQLSDQSNVVKGKIVDSCPDQLARALEEN
ncbi:TSCPD domain-containing protein [Butyricimonas paravirosa]|uniref:TSCPD domain-containing protein n=1 Tax=Butyricimonas paravirosa TaxID=1472417 RepID=UPI00210C5BE4|nr:TSCPD domain-containing protein [Butyricimonas paravirosa]MCQ4874599.1 TSCPD domain-containing protein [Butyricimonas paravirosa]